MSVFSSRYARAFSQVVVAAHLDSGAAQQQLADFAATVTGSRELREVLMDPSIPQEQKVRILDAISGRIGMLPQVRNFVAVIVGHDRLGDLQDILTDYARIADEQSGLVEAEIISAHPLNEADRAQLEQQVSAKAGGTARVSYSQDASLLGGVVVKIGSTVYDGSLKAQLMDMKRRLADAQVV